VLLPVSFSQFTAGPTGSVSSDWHWNWRFAIGGDVFFIGASRAHIGATMSDNTEVLNFLRQLDAKVDVLGIRLMVSASR
jgi:hypothetical protein